MNIKTFVILGGYGNTGRRLAQFLLQETDVRLVLAGRTVAKAEAAAELNRLFPGNRVTATYADASDVASLEQVFVFTVIPVVACLLQYLDDSIRQPGLWTQANLVEPNRLMQDMQRMGIEVAKA